MKQVVKGAFLGIAALMLGLAVCVVSPHKANAQGEADMIADFGELVQWQNDNSSGGTITLSGNIEIDDYIELTNMHINTGDFGFVVSDELVLYGGVNITGGGAGNPLVRVLEGGELHLIGANSLTVNGAGSAALHFEAASRFTNNTVNSRLHVRAEGANSLAIYTETPLKLKGCTLEAGAGAGLITATAPVLLYLSHVTAQEPAALSSNITFDTCLVSPTVTGGNIISRKITKVTPGNQFLFAAGEKTHGYFDDEEVHCTLILSAEGEEDMGETANIEFDDALVNYDKPGEYKMPGVFAPPHDVFYAFDILSEACPVEITVTVYDPNIPYYYASGKNRGTLIINYYYSGAHEALTLWRSDDGGESWRVYWRPGDEGNDTFDAYYDDYSIDLMFPDPAELIAPALFVFEVGTGKGSDILYVDADAIINYGNGGDRDSGDRILLPWEFFNPNNDGDDDGGEDKNTGGKTDPPPNTGGGGGSQALIVSAASDTADGLDDLPGTSENNSNSGIVANAAPAAPRVNGFVPNAANVQSPATALVEYENATTIAISGKRIEALMRTNAQMVPFARQDTQVWIPTSLLANLQLADTDIFTLQIEKSAQSEVSIMFLINDRMLGEPFAEAFLVGIPWTETNEIISCTNSNGAAIPFEYDKQNGLLILTLFECGTCNIEVKSGGIDAGAANNDDASSIHSTLLEAMGEPADENAAPSYAPFAMLAVGAVGTGGAGGLIYTLRKRRVKGDR